MKSAVMFICALLTGSALFGAWSWQRPSTVKASVEWPSSMPRFASGDPERAYTLKTGGSFVCITVPDGRDEALARVRAAFTEAGWSVSPINTSDMLMFTRGGMVAAIIAETVVSGTRLTALQRPSGL